mgnify:CR=1 FL=1
MTIEELYNWRGKEPEWYKLGKKLDEIIAKLKDLSPKRIGECIDKEDIHIMADQYLIDALRLVGRDDVADAYVEVLKACGGFWYA